METDPVCKMAVEPQKAAVKTEHQGKMYYFCSQGCHQKFTAHPDQYVTPKPGSDTGGRQRGHG